MTQISIVQDCLFPGMDFSAPDDLYVRFDANVSTHLVPRTLTFKIGGRAWFDTFYNSISIAAWKRMTIIDNLAVSLEGQGVFLVRAGVHRFQHPNLWILEQIVQLTPDKIETIELPWSDLHEGILYIYLEALTDGELTKGYFSTHTPVANVVHLGIVITHFNRKSFVVPAIRRIQQHLLERTDCHGKIELIVVDNSCNLIAEETGGATIIPNLNLGGSGGFTRGLLHLIDKKNFTHCLFMDDDASCEIESIRRALILQQFSRDSKLAISGALMREIEPYRLFEKGASYNRGVCRPLNHWRDMRNIDEILHAERYDDKNVYGAWWFFCFNIGQIKSFPFPFFVRGDDTLFSLMNDFKIETLNGISCWGEDFQLKENPSTRYLGLRSSLAIFLMTNKVSRVRICRIMFSWFASSLFSYNYGSAQAINKAIRDVAKGPEFWLENINASTILAELATLNTTEKMVPVCLSDYSLVRKGTQESRVRCFLRIITFNGFLLPSFLIRKVIVLDEKSFRGNFRRIFRYQHVLYFYEAMSLGYVAAYNRKNFFRIFLDFLRIIFHFLWNIRQLSYAYKRAMPKMTSEDFWRKIYANK